MHDDFQIRMPLQFATINYNEKQGETKLSLQMRVAREDISGECGMFGPSIADDVTVQLISGSVAKYFAGMMGNIGRPMARFPAAAEHFAEYRLACWIHEYEGDRRGVILAQLPEDQAFRSALLTAVLSRRIASIGFVARFADRVNAPLPTLAAFQMGFEPTFDLCPTYLLHPPER